MGMNGWRDSEIGARMNKNDIQQGLSEIYYYNCSICGQGNLSRDEVHATKSNAIDTDMVNRYKVLFHDASPPMLEQLIRKLVKEIQGKSGYICLRCLEKDCLAETLGAVSNGGDREE